MAAATGPRCAGQTSLLTDAETEAIRPGSTRPWNPHAARDYLTGLGEGTWHAVPRSNARSASRNRRPGRPGRPLEATAECGTTVLVIARRGAYDRVRPAVAMRPCRLCAWRMAIRNGSTGREFALITPIGAEAAVIARSGADPMLAVRVCQAILRSASDGEDWPGDLDSPAAVVQLLALAAAHRPVLYVTEACAEGACDACAPGDESGSRRAECAQVGCGACTPHAGPWAGEWEGTPLPGLLVPAPCSVLAALAVRCLPG